MLVRTLLLLLLLSLATHGWAAPVQLNNGTSPDGKYFITIEPSPNDYEAGIGTLQIRNVHEKRVVGAFEWGQFGPKISANSAVTIWKPDSQAFAINWNSNRGWMACAIYARNGAKWAQLSFPSFQTKYEAKDGWDSRGKGHYVAVAWQRWNVVKMDYEDGLIWRGTSPRPAESEVAAYWVLLRLLQNSQGPYLDVFSVDEKPAAED